MTENSKDKSTDPHFLQLVLSLEMSAMQSMGKLQNPLTGKIERNLELAKSSIDMLNMLEHKTENNLTPDEENLLRRVLYQLRMNFVDELNSEKKSETSKKSSESEKTDSNVDTKSKNDAEDMKPE